MPTNAGTEIQVIHRAEGIQFVRFLSDGNAPKVAGHIYQYLSCRGLRRLAPSGVTAVNYAVLSLRENLDVTLRIGSMCKCAMSQLVTATS